MKTDGSQHAEVAKKAMHNDSEMERIWGKTGKTKGDQSEIKVNGMTRGKRANAVSLRGKGKLKRGDVCVQTCVNVGCLAAGLDEVIKACFL